jgi:hypothetical protein
MVRSILSVIAGLVLAFVLVFVTEIVNMLIFPLPAGIDMHDPEALGAALLEAPWYKLILVPVGWLVATLVGGVLAAKLARRAPRKHALAVGTLLLLVGILNMNSIPHPDWFLPVGTGAFVVGAALAALMVGSPTAPEPTPGSPPS